MGGRADRLDAAALVDRHVGDHRARFHSRHQLAGYEDRRPPPVYVHSTDHQVARPDRAIDVGRVRVEGVQLTLEEVVDIGEARQVRVEDVYFRAQGVSDAQCADADRPGPQDRDPAPRNARNAAEEQSLSPVLLLKQRRTNLDGETGDYKPGSTTGV